MKKILISGFTFCCLIGLGKTTWANFTVSDLVKSGTHNAELMALGMAPELKPLFEKFTSALKNPELAKSLLAKSKPGQPMPYDSRLGMTESEYNRLLDGMNHMQFLSTGQTVPVTFTISPTSILVQTSACTALSSGLKIDLPGNTVSPPGFGTLTARYFENRTTPLAPSDGYTWSSSSLNPPKKFELVLFRRIKENNCVLSCDTLSMNPPRRESVMLRYECVSAASPTTTGSTKSPSPPSDNLGGLSALDELDRMAKDKDISPPPAKPVTAMLTEKRTESAPPPPPLKMPDPNAMVVPAKTTGSSPGTICRAALSRYPYVAPVMVTRCKEANEFSAHAVDVYTFIYKGGMGDDLLVNLLKIKNQDQEECAIQIAKQFAGSMTAKYLQDTCL